MIIRLFLELALCQATRCIATEFLPKSGTMMLLVLGANVAANSQAYSLLRIAGGLFQFAKEKCTPLLANICP